MPAATATAAATMAVVTLEDTPEVEMPAGPTAAHRVVETAAVEAGMVEAGGDQPIEHSALEHWHDEDGITLKVLTYRVISVDLRWLLEVVDHNGGLTCWDRLFRTDLEALEAFEDCLETEGALYFSRLATRH